MDASAADLRDRYLRALAQGNGFTEELWHLFVEHPWYQRELEACAKQVVRLRRTPPDWEDEIKQEVPLLLRDKLTRVPHLWLNAVFAQTKFAAWLGRIILRDCIQVVRRLTRQYPGHAQVKSTDRVTDDLIEKLEDQIDIELMIRRLPEGLGSLVKLWFEGYTPQEIAQHLGYSDSKTYRLLWRGFAALVRLLGKDWQ